MTHALMSLLFLPLLLTPSSLKTTKPTKTRPPQSRKTPTTIATAHHSSQPCVTSSSSFHSTCRGNFRILDSWFRLGWLRSGFRRLLLVSSAWVLEMGLWRGKGEGWGCGIEGWDGWGGGGEKGEGELRFSVVALYPLYRLPLHHSDSPIHSVLHRYIDLCYLVSILFFPLTLAYSLISIHSHQTTINPPALPKSLSWTA